MKRRSKGQRFGGSVDGVEDGGRELLQVTDVDPNGILAKYNADNAGRTVKVNDVIISVNGLEGNWRRMRAKIQDELAVSLVLLRP